MRGFLLERLKRGKMGVGLLEDEMRNWSIRAVLVGCGNVKDWRWGYIRGLGVDGEILNGMQSEERRLKMWTDRKSVV